MPDNVDKLFEIMQAKGAASDRDKFRKVFLTPGNKGYKIRKDIYDGLRADGIIDSPTYEVFRRKLRLGGTPTVNKYRQLLFNSVDPNKSRASELTKRAIGQAARATNIVRKPVVAKVVDRKGKPTGEEIAIIPAKTVEDLDREYAQEVAKNWENELHDQMADADKDAAKISDMFKSFIGSTDEVGSVWGNMTRGGGIAGTPHSVTTNNGILKNTKSRQILAAGDYNRKRRELLQLEQDARNGAIFDNHSFFRGMYDAAKDTGFLTGGASDLINAGSLLATKQDLDNGVHTEAGDMLMQQAVKNSDAQSQYGDNQGWMYTGGVITTNMAPFMVQIGSAGFSKGMSTSIGKVVQGAASKVALGTMEKATGMAGAHIANCIGKVTGLTTKAFGKAIQYGIVGAAQANTVGLGNVANDVVNRYTGQVYQDEQGNYKFGTFDSDGKLVHEGGEDFLTSLVKGEAAQTIEFGTELAGGGIDAVGTALKNFVTKGGKKIINKYNMENVSKVIDFLLNNKVSKNARYLKAGADRTLGKVELNSIVGESLEEELGIIANTVFTGDNKISDLWDEKQQSQIWGGMLLSIGLMKGAVAPFHAYNAKQYYSYKHKLNKADVNLSQLLGKEKWDELRNKIDATTNKDMPELINKINRDVALGKNRQPVREYIQNLLIMRGYDIGNMLAAKKAVEDKGKGVSVKNMEKNQAYQQGRDAYGYDTHEIQLDQADKQKTLAQLLGITEQQLSTMSDEELDNLSGRDDNLDKAIYDYQLSTIRYQGVADNAQDQVDLAAQKAAQAVDMYTDKSRNTIRNATIKAAGGLEDYGVYVINGNIATHDDGSIDVGNSDDMILFYDPTTNTVEHADATRFAELGSEENADEVRNQAVADAKENAIKEITGIIDGVVEVGTQFKTIDADGTEHTYEVLADNGDGTAMITIDGNIPTQLVKGENVNVPVSFEELQKMKDASDQQRLQAAKAQREQMEKERAEQQMQAQTTQAENPVQEDNIQSAPIEDNLDYSDIIREDGKVQMVDVSDKDGNNLFPEAKDVFYIQGNKMRTKFAYIDANGELKKQSFPTGLVKIKTRGEVSVDDYKKYRSMILSAESSAMPESSMIEDNSGTIEADRGGIEVEDNTQPLSEADADNVIAQMESSAEVAPELELTPDNWVVEFGEDGIVSTPIGDVKMGENQVAKLFEKGRSKKFGMIKPTLTNPDVIIEVPSHSADGNEERSSSYLFIKTFLGKNGEKVYYFKSVTIKKDGLEISISSHYDRAKRVKEALMKGKLLYRKNDGAQTEQNQPSASVTTSQEDAAGSSENKDTNISANGNENNESLTFEDGTPIPVDANGETDLSQTDAAHAAEWYDNNLGDDADDWLDGEIKKAKKVLEQAKNKKLTGTKPSELVASKKEKEAAIADAQAHYDSAISIRDSLKERRIAKEENTAEGRKNLIEKARRKFSRLKSAVKDDAEAVSQLYKDVVGSLLHRLYDGTGIDVTDTIPLTAEEYVASNLGAHSLNYEGTETSKGVKQETGLSREDFAKTQLLAADGKGTTIDDLVHSLWENRPSNLESLDTQDILNALIGVLNSGFKASEARNYIENLRIAQAENILEEQKKAADNAAFAKEQTAPAEEQTETAPESEQINDEENEQTNEQTNAPEQNKFPDKLKDGSETIEVPEDATDENPLGLQLGKDKVPFEIEGGKSGETYNINDNEDRQRLINDNKVDDKDILDIDMPKHVHKAIKELCKKMGLKVQFLYMGARSNGWIENGTMYLALDTEKATQFVFGHEMTHAIKQKNPEVYKELVKVAMAVTTRKKFEEDLAKVYQNYYGISGYNNVDDYVEEVVADNLGKFINDFDLAQKFSLRLNHPVLATILHAIQKIKSLLYGDFYKSVDALERIVEKAYVKTAKGEVTNSETGEDVSFSLRQKPEPKKKGIGYKVFVLKDGKLYPPMVANPDGAATPVGVWLDADAAPIAGESKTGRPQVKQGGKGTQGGSGKLAYRPGWHLGVVPYAIQFNRKDAEGNKTLFPKNFVFAEVEYAADVDYQEEARKEGINPSGKYQHSLAGLKHLPTDGFYMYRTNPNPETDPWVITGAMKVNRILTRAEQAELVKTAGREPQQIQEGDIVTDDVVNSINQEIADAPKFSLKVYHGSGADFTEFDFDHMGEGAGSQAFGWGGYVTSSKKIGKNYATLMDNDPSRAYYRIQHSNGTRFAKKYPTLESFLHGDKQIAMNDKFTEQEKIDYYNEMKKLAEPYHNLYEVDIPDDNGSNYLDWDAPLTDKQKNTIIKELRRLKIDFADFKKRGFSFDGSFGGNSYDFLMYALRKTKKWKDVNASRAVSKFLSSLGYTGIKYKAGRNFGGAEEGDTNYVIFKPEDMRITEHTKFSIKTYHGSQASFDHFDHSFMGSGEGAQAYGWGTYVSEVEGIAKAYAKSNAKKNAPSRLMYQGKPMTYKTPSIIYQVALDMDKFNISAKEAISKMIDAVEKKLASVSDTPFAKMKAKQDKDELKVLKGLNPSDFKINDDYDTVAQNLADTKSGLDLLEDELKDAKSYVDLYQSRLDEAKGELSKAKESGTGLGVDMYESDVAYYSEQVERYKQNVKTKESDIKDVKTKVDALRKKLDSMEKPRNLYSVDIPDDTGKNYLDWDGRLPKTYINRVNKALEASGHKTIDTLYPSRVDGKLVGQDLYDRLRSELGSQKAASLLLKDAGFVGVKVIAQRNAGGNKDGKMNYVIFDENNAKITSHTKFSLKDNQGNPLNQDGTLKLDKIKSVDELTDEDFLHPTRNVELPSLPKKIADAIGTEGKPVVIKKNIFERNYMRHKDVTPELSKVIFKSALYNPDLYGQNQKKTRPYNWVLINTKDEKGNNRTVLLEVNPNKDNVEIVHWHFVNDKNLGLIKKQAIREGDQVLILPSEQSEEVGGLSNLTDDLSAAKIDNSSETAKENGEKFSLKDEKTMFGMHNISIDKLRKAIKQGGFAAPSMGVVDSKNGIYSDYGEITLIPKAEKLAKRTGKNAGTFTADAWTPTYPQVERIMNKQGEKAFNADMNVKLGDVDNGIYSNVRESWKGYLSSGDVRDGLYWHYLFDKGMNPETIYQTGKYDNDITNEVMRISDNGSKTDYTDEEVAELIQLKNKATGEDNDVEAMREKLKARIASAEKKGNHLLAALKKKRLAELEGVENFYIAADFVNDVVRNNRKNGKVDVHDTMSVAKEKVENDKKLSADFPSWLDKKTEEYGVEEMLYNGTTPSGKPKYIPNTIDNAVKLMKKQGVAGGYTAFGSELGVFIAKNSPEVNTLAAMKNAKDKLIPFGDERHNQIKDKITKEFLELSDEIRVGSNNRYAFDDSGVSRMVELTDHKGNEKEYLKKAYNVEVSDEWMDRYNKLLDTIKKDYKVFYFETKFMRPYGLDEFEKAIVPSDTPSDVVDVLKKAGIDVSSYERGNAEDRQKVTMDAINSSDNIRFSLKEEKEKIVTDAKANGTYMTAPNGEKTKLDAEQWATVRTANFKNWFGDWENDPENASKVVDENGEPMVVWHGRSAEFNTFEKKEGVRFIMGLEDKVKAEGFFFSPDKGLAEEFASNSSRHRGGKANVVPCFLDIRRPMDLTGEDYDRIYEDVTGWEYMVGMDTQDNLWGIMDEEGMADKIKEKGYDGAIFVEEVDDSYEPTKISYCALDANQIKSAENNNGDFSADNNDIRFSLRGSTPYDKQMEEWMEKNHLEKGAVPMEKPIMKEGENIFDYANRMVEWTRNQNLWKTAPKKAGFQDALAKWKADNGLSPDAYPPVRPHRENYSTEIGYTEDLEEYNKKKELWKSAPKPKDFDLSVDLEDMNKQLRNIRRAVLNQKNYDQRTVKAVSDLVRKMLNIGWGDGLSRGKVGNLLSAAKNATGANDVKTYLDKAMGILAENYLNRLSTAYDNLINTKGARADQSGVIKMGSLDAKGQAFMSEYKKAINMDDSSLNTYIANIEEDSAKNEDNMEMNDYRLAGIQAAIMYKQQIGGNDADIAELKRQIGELKNKKDATKEDKDLLKSLEKKLFENKFDRITMYENLLNNIQRMVKESKGRAKEFREEITEHKNEILHRANLDLEGVDSTYYDTTTAKKKFVNNDLQRAVFSSTYTFEQFLKFFGKKAANGEGYLYNYFTKLNQDALDEEQLYNEMNRNALDEKTKELFGKEKFMKLVGIDGKGMKEMDVEVTDYSNKETGKRTIHLKQGQMLYIYLVNKETDGGMKLRAMGITEEDVAAIEENLDPRVKAMGEWLQDEYLPECQRRYQATHTKYFGAPMKEVENYFPLAINNRARNVKEDVNQDSDAMSQLAGTSTGAIVTRRVNVIPLDIENADAFEVAFNHLQEMEEWSAMLPFRQDVNTLLSYTHFRNQVQNMSSVAYGSGKTLWDEFKQTAQIAAGTYKPKVNAGMMDSRIAAAMGGIAVAKISGRLWTAIKQSQSATVFLPECDFTRFVKNGVNPYGSWKWAMENIPDFRKRVENMTYGDVKLRQYLDELEKWHDWTKTISKVGMAPNILVDGITCAVGARSVYETEVNRLTKLGYPKEKAEEKAYYKAVAAYNKTQQSSGGMYLSPMQVDRTYASAALSLFKNANYAYGRMQIEACRGLARTYDFWGGKHKTTLIESMTRQIMEEDGLDENTARAIAKATYNRTFRQSIGRLINFATLVPVSWALYKVLPYLLTGDDDDKKNDMIEEAVLKGFATSLSDNYVIPFASNILNAGLKVEDGKPTFDPEVFKWQSLYINPATSDLANIYSMIGNQKWYSVANKLGMLGVQSLIGFNPETVGALYQAFAEADYDNGNVAKEWQIGILKAISAPEESIRELYMDELGLKSGDIKKIPLAELEKRYAERQINRDNLLSQVFMDAEDFNGYVDKYQKSFEKKIKDKMDKWDEYDKKKADEFFDTTSDPKLKDMIAKKRTNDANAAADEQIAKEGLNQEKKGKEPSEEAYDAVKMSIDVAEDNAISTYNKVLNKRYAALNDEYNNQTDAMKYIFMSKHPNFKAYKDLKSEYTTYGKKIKELKEKLVSADGYDAKQTILKQIRAERDKFYELQSKVR